MAKSCCICKEDKGIEEFHRSRQTPDGRDPRCKACRKAAAAAYYKAHRDQILARTSAYSRDNREKVNGWAKEFKRRHKERLRPEKNRLNMARHAAKKGASPAWLDETDKWIMNEVYELAVYRSRLTGVAHQVDHIIPLNGDGVCGLHVPWNLQVLTASENARKSNRY